MEDKDAIIQQLKAEIYDINKQLAFSNQLLGAISKVAGNIQDAQELYNAIEAKFQPVE